MNRNLAVVLVIVIGALLAASCARGPSKEEVKSAATTVAEDCVLIATALGQPRPAAACSAAIPVIKLLRAQRDGGLVGTDAGADSTEADE